MKPQLIGRMNDGKSCSQRYIEQRVMAAIRPQLDRADELLDHYLADAPVEVWLPIADRFNPAIDVIYIDVVPDMRRWKELIL